MFAEAVGAWTILLHYAAVNSVIADDKILVDAQNPHSANLFTDDEIQTQVRYYFDTTVASLALYSFVYPFERYKKMVENLARQPDTDVPFGLDYKSQAGFVAAYPRAVITTFTPMMNGTDIRAGWLSSMIRNSSAHGQTQVLTNLPGYVGQKRIRVWNRATTGVITLDMHMELRDFVLLTAEALHTFVAFVVEGGKYQPLSKMLEYELH